MRLIDPHLHLFDLAKGDYHWLKSENPPYWPDKATIARDFSCHDLLLDAPLSLAGFVHIEAGFDNQAPWREIAWLEETIKPSCQLAFKTVATIDLSADITTFKQSLVKLSGFSSVVGVRHILDDDAASVLSQADILEKFRSIATHDFHFELQLSLADLPAVNLLVDILDNLPELRVIINHAGWPSTNLADDHNWQQSIQVLAGYNTVAIKCSGWEMTKRHYDSYWQQQVVDYTVGCFGEHRVMLASNFPLTLFSTSYQALWQNYRTSIVDASLASKLMFENAYLWYGFAR
ncbi:amidohydrolase family protein [Thalassotalea euphylliae]|uniref:Amidohydrolase n=1 Tax=Thalassotalea euphylliae TaxID=1655234 RepID=A0A3E0UCZ4_9GAMM|nr:amidohydrolase family protein [Thalassotalea euphylliae]REL34749.1 amidohydrolase [Thalassotalea euphylliae]